jgi:crotonobetainyl-CoA:carnitine CoA-transferase CaiB-like acyl-CoA transferase
VTAESSPPGPPLAGLRVVDLTDIRGALAGRMLADLGADVIKVEPPGGDPDRLRGPFAGGVAAPDRSLPFLFRHANKRGAPIDLDTTAGQQRVHDLCAEADVLVENLGRDAAERRGLGPAAVRARHPHLVHVALADFGQSGPRAAWRLEPLAAFAASGALYASGFPDRAPCWLPGYLAHDCAAVAGVTGALAALLEQTRSGLGQTVEVSVQEAALAGLEPWGIPVADYARVYAILPTHYPRDADGPAPVLATADGYVRVLALTPRQWRALVALFVGRESAAKRGDADTGRALLPGRGTWAAIGAGLSTLLDEALRVSGHGLGAVARLPLHGVVLPVVHGALAALRLVAREALATRPRARVVAQARGLALPMAPLNTPDDFTTEEQTRARGYFLETGFAHVGKAPFAPFPCRLSRTPAVLRRGAPEPDGSARFAPRSRPGPDAGPTGQPSLAGTRVVSLGVGAVVPGLCRTLAELGAEVIKIECRTAPDFLRRLTPDPTHPDSSWTFNDENRGHRSVCLDLGTARGRDLALALCARADVVAENRRGGVVAGWGLDYESVRRLRSDVVYVSSQGYGRGGPLGDAPAFGPVIAAFAGATFLWNHPDAPYPGGSSLEHPDHVAGKLLAVAVLAALDHRRRTGEGQQIEMAQSEAAAYLLGEFYLEGPCTGQPPHARGNAVEYACPHGVYPTCGDDRWCAIAVVGEDAWQRFRRVVCWEAERRFDSLAGRLDARAELDARVAAWTRVRTAEAAADVLQAAGVSAMAVQAPYELRDDPHLAARAALVTLDDPGIGGVRHVANPIRMGRTPTVVAGPAPRLGADTRAVLTGVLGLSRDDVAALVRDGVCG